MSLRGLGSSGASRSLVLWDGIPVNDPFGGWVYWTRLSPEEIERVELSRGAATSVFGDRAMSGAISLFSRPAERLHLIAAYEGGNKNTHMLTGGLSHLWGRFGVSGTVRAFTTDGYYVVAEENRGAVDTPAGVRFVSGVTRVDYLGARDRLFVKFDVLAEERANGTVLTHNSTNLGTLAGQLHAAVDGRHDFAARLSHPTGVSRKLLGGLRRSKHRANHLPADCSRRRQSEAPACGVIMRELVESAGRRRCATRRGYKH